MEPVVLATEFPLSELWGTAIGFVGMFTAVIFAMGIGSRNLAIGAFGAYLSFAYFAMATDIAVLEPLLFVTLTLIIIAAAMKAWRMEGVDVS